MKRATACRTTVRPTSLRLISPPTESGTMSWVRTVRDWTTRSATKHRERRTTNRFDHVAVEELEPRLCLGGLTAPPAAPESTSPGPLPAEVAPVSPSLGESFESSVSALEPGTTETSVSEPTTGSASPTATDLTKSVEPSFTDVFASDETDAGEGGQVQAVLPTNTNDTQTTGGGSVQSLHNTGGGGDGVTGPDRSAEESLGGTASLAEGNEQMPAGEMPWWMSVEQNVTVKYDFRDQNGYQNLVSEEEQAVFVEAFEAWSEATDGKVVFVRDTAAADDEIVNVGVGDLAAYGYTSESGGVLGLGGGQLELLEGETVDVTGAIWLDGADEFDLVVGNGDVEGKYDFFTVAAHETGHVLGYDDSYSGDATDVMNGAYRGERLFESVRSSALGGTFYTQPRSGDLLSEDLVMRPMTDPSQLVQSEVNTLLRRASAATASNDAIIAVVDRNGRILGVRVESGVPITDTDTLIFAIDGAVAKARTAAFFSNGDPNNGTLAPLTSRLVQFLSQSTNTQREVESNPNVGLTSANPAGTRTAAEVYASTVFGPGTVGPIGVGGHFPPEIMFTPPVDLFEIENTNRDTVRDRGADGIIGTADDPGNLLGRFNSPELAGADGIAGTADDVIFTPDSYGVASGLLPTAQGRGIATLPGGIPLYRDSNGDGIGDTLVGGIGVFFPGPDGFATHEQGFVQGIGQTQTQRVNADRVLEAEYIAFAAAGGSLLAGALFEEAGTKIGNIAGIAPVAGLDLPFGRLDLVGITLPVLGPYAGKNGLNTIIELGQRLGEGTDNGANQTLVGGDANQTLAGQAVAEGWLVPPKDGNGITAAEVQKIISQGLRQTERTRAAVRLPLSSQTQMVLAVADIDGQIVGLFREKDATVFSIDVAVAKARNVAYYANGNELNAFDQVNGVPNATAFTARTFRFLAEPRFPSGIDGTRPPQFSILNQPSIEVANAENIFGPAPAGNFDPSSNPNTATVVGYDTFFPGNNFQDANNPENQNGVVFFPGSTPVYRNGTQLIGGLGVSGDGVDQDDVVTFVAAQGFLPQSPVLRADNVFVNGVRLPYQKFLRNPEGSVTPFS